MLDATRGRTNPRKGQTMMAADMNDDPLERSTQDHLTREAVLHAVAIRAMLKAARGLDQPQHQHDDEPVQQRLQTPA
jgi:hypothetical protein